MSIIAIERYKLNHNHITQNLNKQYIYIYGTYFEIWMPEQID